MDPNGNLCKCSLLFATVTRCTAEHIQIIITSAQIFDNVVLTQVWYKPPFGAIRG